MRFRRSMLFVPGSNPALLSTAFVYRSDSVMFDLEDAVAPREKDSARLLVFHALHLPEYKNIESVVRINPLDSAYGLKDLEAAVRGGADIVRLPKTEGPESICQLESEVARLEKQIGRRIGETKLMAAIESASGVGNALAIATASPRMIAIALAGFDYLVDMQTRRSGGFLPALFLSRAPAL